MSIRCKECEYCKNRGRRYYAECNEFVCGHPNSSYIEKYYKEHKIHRMLGFIGTGEPLAREPKIATSPRWCPKKEKKE